MDWNKSTADAFLKGIFNYMHNESLRDLHLSPELAFNPHVHSTAFLVDVHAILNTSTTGFIAMKCGRKWADNIVFPSTATIKELAKTYRIPLEVRARYATACTDRLGPY